MPMTPEQVADHERAAVALETHKKELCALARRAAVAVWRKSASWIDDDEVDNRAARLLRECIEKGEPLP